jgi:hypothetical protein
LEAPQTHNHTRAGGREQIGNEEEEPATPETFNRLQALLKGPICVREDQMSLRWKASTIV